MCWSCAWASYFWIFSKIKKIAKLWKWRIRVLWLAIRLSLYAPLLDNHWRDSIVLLHTERPCIGAVHGHGAGVMAWGWGGLGWPPPPGVGKNENFIFRRRIDFPCFREFLSTFRRVGGLGWPPPRGSEKWKLYFSSWNRFFMFSRIPVKISGWGEGRVLSEKN